MSRTELLAIIDELNMKLESMKAEVQQATMDRTHLSIENRQLKLKMLKLQNQIATILKADETGRFLIAPNFSGKGFYHGQWIVNPGLFSYNPQKFNARDILHHSNLSSRTNIPDKAKVKLEQLRNDNRGTSQHMAANHSQPQGKNPTVKPHISSNFQPINPKLHQLEILSNTIPHNSLYSGFAQRTPPTEEDTCLKQEKQMTGHGGLKSPPLVLQTTSGFSRKRKIHGLKYSASCVDLKQVDEFNRKQKRKKRKRSARASFIIEQISLGERRKTWIFCLHCNQCFYLLPLKDRDSRNYRTRAMFRHRCKNGKRLRLNVIKKGDNCTEEHTGPCIRLISKSDVGKLQSQKPVDSEMK